MFVYCVTNNANGKRYIGKTERTVAARWEEHVEDSVSRPHIAPLFYRAIRKYGAENFTITVLAETENAQQLNDLERYWIGHYHAAEKESGYNLTLGGTGGKPNAATLEKLRKPKTAAHCVAISAAAKKRPHSTAHLNTAEARQKKSKTLKGRVFSEETIAKMKIAAKQRGNKAWTPARRAKHSARMQGANNPSFGKAFPAPALSGMLAAKIWAANNPETLSANCRKATLSSWNGLTEQEKQKRLEPMRQARWKSPQIISGEKEDCYL